MRLHVELQRQAEQLREERDAARSRVRGAEEESEIERENAEAAEAELQRLRGGISVRDALVTENVIRAAAAEAEVERLREGLREALAIIENSREFGLPLNVPVVDVVVERGRALLAAEPDQEGEAGGWGVQSSGGGVQPVGGGAK